MALVNPQDRVLHMKVGDLAPALKIKLYDESTDPVTVFNLTPYTGKFYLALLSDKSQIKVNGSAVTITSAVNGEAEYQWTAGDTNTAGTYCWEFRFTTGGKTFSVPLVSPGTLIIESHIA